MNEQSWKEAIHTVLAGSVEPLHYTDIADAIAEQGLRTSLGATPGRTILSVLSTALKQDGTNSPFFRAGNGYYGLRETTEHSASSAAVGSSGVPTPEDELESEAGLVNALGMYWNRELVDWKYARILGQAQVNSSVVDFSQQRGVYLLHDRREVVYVGRIIDQGLGARLKQHTHDRLSGRWDRFSWFGLYPVNDDSSLGTAEDVRYTFENLIAALEAVLIEGLEPRQNRRRGDGLSAVEFIQVKDPELERRERMEQIDRMTAQLKSSL